MGKLLLSNIATAKQNVIPDLTSGSEVLIGDPENNLDSRLRGNDKNDILFFASYSYNRSYAVDFSLACHCERSEAIPFEIATAQPMADPRNDSRVRKSCYKLEVMSEILRTQN